MSYILDALRRADAERERDRGAVPSLHSQQYGALPGDEDASERRPLVLIGIVVAVVLALAIVLVWSMRRSADSTPRTTAAEGTLRPALPASAAPPPLLLPTTVTPPTPPQATAPSPTPPSRSTASTGKAPAETAPSAETRRRLRAAAASMAAAKRHSPVRSTVRAPNVAPAAPAVPANVGTDGRLPETLRRELPTLAFGGASYSKDPASRMVIFNGRVFHEGETIALDLVLKQIDRKAAIFTYKGYRYVVEF